MDFVHNLVFQNLENLPLQNLKLLPSSDEGRETPTVIPDDDLQMLQG
jgi:hypothetical protein